MATLRASLVALAVLAIALTAASSATAQTALGTIRGTLKDEQGGALPGVTVTARQTATNMTQTAVSGVSGQYFVANLPAGPTS